MASRQLAEARGVILEWVKPNYEAPQREPQFWVRYQDARRGYLTEPEARRAWRRKVYRVKRTWPN